MAQVTSCFSGACQVRFGFSFISRKPSPDATQRMDDDGSPGRVASIDQDTSPKVGKVASEGTSEARASSSSDWGAWTCRFSSGMKSTKSTTVDRRVSPDAAGAIAQEKARKLENALELPSKSH